MKQGFLGLGRCHPATLPPRHPATLGLPAGTWAGVSRLHPLLLSPSLLHKPIPVSLPTLPPPLSLGLGNRPFPTPASPPDCLTDQLPGTSPASPGLSLSFPCSELTCPPAHCFLSGWISFSPLLPPPGNLSQSQTLLQGLLRPHALSGYPKLPAVPITPHLCPAGPGSSLDVPTPNLVVLVPEPWCWVARRSDALRLHPPYRW